MIRSSRSKIVSAHYCRRYRYLKYHYNGTGLQKVSQSIEAVSGQVVHDCLAHIAKFPGDIDNTIVYHVAKMEGYLREKFPLHPNLEHEILEQRYVAEGLIRAWLRVRKPLIDEEFELISVEKETNWKLSAEVEMPLRLDRLERRRSDGTIYIRDFKTTSKAGMDWVRKWERDHQILSYVAATEEITGEYVGGLCIEGLVRGQKKRENTKSPMFPGMRIQQTPLCYVYVNQLSGEISPEYQRGNAWQRKPLWTLGISPKEWIEKRLTAEQVSELFIAPVPAIAPNRNALERWRRQSDALERELEAAASGVALAHSLGKVHWLTQLDMAFPMNQDACYKYGEDYGCEFENICYNGEVEDDPIGSGMYEPRIDHHGDE